MSWTPKKKASKFHNHSFDNADGHWDSMNEYRRWLFLKDAERQGLISGLRRQVVFELLPKQEKEVVIHLKTKDKIEKRVVFSAVTYSADFVYEKKDGINYSTVVEDFKGWPNDRWPLKKAMMYFFHGIEIREVKKPGEPI